jgi:hypothetical protein
VTTATASPAIPQAEIERLLATRPQPAAEKRAPGAADAPRARSRRDGFLSAVRDLVEDVIGDVIDGS